MKFKQVKLSEVANLFAGYPFKGNNYSDKGVRVVRGDNVTIGHLRWTIGKDKRWNEPFDQFEYYSLHENDIVIGMDGSRVGMNRAQIKHEDLPLLLAQRVACIRNNSNSIQDYLYYQIFSNNFVQYIKAIHTGTSIPHVSLKQIGDFGIPLPSLSDQRKIAGILSALDAKIENNNKINANLEAQAQALFKSWFVDFTPFKDQPFVDSELGPIPQGW
ncbi:MAG: restriction endonuclease subunit S, partial [Bacteroidales bacterium]|nr:restriction endonuclease subunit S [Bacteroidales bacterium]